MMMMMMMTMKGREKELHLKIKSSFLACYSLKCCFCNSQSWQNKNLRDGYATLRAGKQLSELTKQPSQS
jgi:hypothetical protein